MRSELETLLEEFERLTLDDRIFLTFLNEQEIEVHVQYRKSEGRNWCVWFPINPAASKQTVSRQHFPLVLNAFAVAESAFTAELGNVLLTQAAWADEFVRSVGNLLGVEAVRRSILDTQNFMDSFKEAMQGFAAEGSATPEALLPHEAPAEVRSPDALGSGSAKTRLRIIRNP